ncbi:MAG: hypothetical protein IJY92_01390 [Alphaproteobacteria bacterium]|nr:hypothetical protein [Alphaproteobacteria bacterium]
MKTTEKETSEIFDHTLVLAGIMMLGATGYYLHTYAKAHAHPDEKKPAIHSIEAKKVSTSQPISSIQLFNKNNQNIK